MNYGLDIVREINEQSAKDWVFGSASQKCLADIPHEERIDYLPKGEVQRGAEDTKDCASRAPVNILEAKFNWLIRNNKLSKENTNWLRERGYITKNGVEFSDAFVAINSGTTRQGNSLKAPLEAIRIHGLVPKKRMPLEKWMTWEDYHNPKRMVGSIVALGHQFTARFTINYEKVFNFKEALETDMIDVGGYAWPEPKEGAYPRVNNTPNHAWVNFALPAYLAFDNYTDSVDGDFIKLLDPEYKFVDWGYRVYISEERKPKIHWLKKLIQLLYEYLSNHKQIKN